MESGSYIFHRNPLLGTTIKVVKLVGLLGQCTLGLKVFFLGAGAGQPSGQLLTYDFCMITEEGRHDFLGLRLPVPSTVHIYLSKDLLVFALIPITELNPVVSALVRGLRYTILAFPSVCCVPDPGT
jgi:hypothetical protein